VVLAFAAVSFAVVSSSAAGATVSLARPAVSWMGGPLRGASPDATTCPASSCNDFSFRIDIPPSAWSSRDGGVAVRVAWPDPNDEIDLHVFDQKGVDVAMGLEAHTNAEQALIHAPVPGMYRVHVVATHAVNVVYHGTARVVRLGYRFARTMPVTMRFAPASFVDPQLWTSEPSVWASKDGSIAATSIWSLNQGSSMVWRSGDGGRTFNLKPSVLVPGAPDPRERPCNAAIGGADADVITDRTGRMYFADLWLVSSVIGTSTDGGNTWSCNPVATSSPELDRPWLAPSPTADGAGPNVDAYLAYRDALVGAAVPYLGDLAKPFRIHIDVTRDGGKTWKNASTYAKSRVGFAGPIFTAADGTLYQVYQYESSVYLAHSSDQGRTVHTTLVSRRIGTPAEVWVSGDVDAAGNVYVAWVDQGDWLTFFTRSTDHGAHWSVPLRVNPPASQTTVMPWVAAGRRGQVAVSWYGTAANVQPDFAPPATRWYPWVARTSEGTTSSPRFEISRLSPTPVRFGTLCTDAIMCSDRKFGDFYEIAIASDGGLIATFNDDARIQTTMDGKSPGPYVMAVRQVSGLGMRRSSASFAEPSGDATPPDDMGGADVSSLDLASLPQVRSLHGAFQIGLKLRSATNLASALTTPGSIATDAYWLTLWRTANRVEYAGLHVARNGKATFFGGDAPVSVGRLDPLAPGLVDKLASYPATFTLTGRIDARTRSILIDVPLGRFHLSPGSYIYSLQAFSMTALTDRRTFLLPYVVIDSTAAQTLRIS